MQLHNGRTLPQIQELHVQLDLLSCGDTNKARAAGQKKLIPLA